MMSTEDFARSRRPGDPQRTFGAGETPPEIAAPLLALAHEWDGEGT